MTYIDGKRCFINQRILGIDGRRALLPAPRRQRPVLAGGDATTDISMLKDATGVHVVLNRNRDELMCVAYDNRDGRWAVNPMFIEPLPRKVEPLPVLDDGVRQQARQGATRPPSERLDHPRPGRHRVRARLIA